MSYSAAKTPATTWVGFALAVPFLMAGAAIALLPAVAESARSMRVPTLLSLAAYVVFPPVLGAISRFAYPNAPRRATYGMLGLWLLLMVLLVTLATAVPVDTSTSAAQVR